MKSSERKTICPVCLQEVSAEFIRHHIANKARRERESLSRTEKRHNNYLVAFKIEKSIM